MKNPIADKFNKLSGDKKKEFLVKLQDKGEQYGIFPLSNLQKSLLFPYLIKKEDSSYNIRFLMHFSKELETEILKKAVGMLIYRNTALRTRLLVLEDSYFQIVKPAGETAMEVVESENMEWVQEELEEESGLYFDLEEENPIRLRLYHIKAEDQYVLSVSIHHMFCDGWSVEVFARELRKYYCGLKASNDDMIQMPKNEYFRCFHVNESPECFAFWQSYLQDGSLELHMPVKEQLADHTLAVRKTELLRLGKKEELDKLAARYQVSSYCLALGLYLEALHKWCGQQKIGIGIATLNRGTAKAMDCIGLFANTLPILDIHDNQESTPAFYERIQKELNQVLEYSGVDSERILKESVYVPLGESHELYQTVFLSSEKIGKVEQMDQVTMYMENIDNSNRIQFDIICCIEKVEDAYVLRIDYRDLLFEETKIQELACIYKTIIGLMAEDRKLILDFTENTDVVKQENLVAAEDEEYDDTTNQIIEIWKEFLGHGEFTIDDNFFTIGGNSLYCIKMVSRLNSVFGKKAKVTDIFKCYTVRKLAEFLSGQQKVQQVNMIQM